MSPKESNIFINFVFIYTKMIIKKDCKKKLVKEINIFLKKKKKKSDNMLMKDTKISQKIKNKSHLGIEKSIIKWEKTP